MNHREQKEFLQSILRRLNPRVTAGITIVLIVLALTGALRSWQTPAMVLPEPSENASSSIVESDPESIPLYRGEDVIELNGGVPCFNAWDLAHTAGEQFSEHDSLGRCGTAVAMLDRSMMPTGQRSDIGDIKPTGWKQRMYEGYIDADPPALYNRSHLIAYALTGQNANPRNLITGTDHLNHETMLPYEEQVMRYLDLSDNHVLYRVSPYFKDRELLARGVEMEAYSVEDEGRVICYHVFVYNVQPGIELDYATGESHIR